MELSKEGLAQFFWLTLPLLAKHGRQGMAVPYRPIVHGRNNHDHWLDPWVSVVGSESRGGHARRGSDCRTTVQTVTRPLSKAVAGRPTAGLDTSMTIAPPAERKNTQ